MNTQNGAVKATMTLPGIQAKRGRLSTGKAMTAAQRQAKYRREHAEDRENDRIENTIRSLAEDFDLNIAQVRRELLRFALCNRNWRRAGFPGVTK